VLRFLLVEDDPSCSFLMAEQLTELGAEVTTAETVADAIRRLGDGSTYDLVILDQELPDGTGFEVQEFLRGVREPPAVLFVTSDDLAEDAVRAMKAGARGYVIKRPRYLDELKKEVSVFLSAVSSRPKGYRAEYEQRERLELIAALERNEWNVTATARELGVGRGKLRRRMASLGINP